MSVAGSAVWWLSRHQVTNSVQSERYPRSVDEAREAEANAASAASNDRSSGSSTPA